MHIVSPDIEATCTTGIPDPGKACEYEYHHIPYTPALAAKACAHPQLGETGVTKSSRIRNAADEPLSTSASGRKKTDSLSSTDFTGWIYLTRSDATRYTLIMSGNGTRTCALHAKPTCLSNYSLNRFTHLVIRALLRGCVIHTAIGLSGG
jgi:hypothetical protein